MQVNRDLESLVSATREHVNDVLLFLAAFDGVLTAYEENPHDARVPRRRLALLRQLQQTHGVVVGVISGRPLADLLPRIPLTHGAVYIGLHGLEVAGAEFGWSRTAEVSGFHPQVHELAIRLGDVVADTPGVRLECKGPVIALHTREASSEDAVWSRFQLLRGAAELLNNGSMRVLRGNEVLELLPNVGNPRADAVVAVRRSIEHRRHQHVFTVYVGEDAADDDTVGVLDDQAVAAVLGRRRSKAHYHLSLAEDVDFFISELIASRRQ